MSAARSGDANGAAGYDVAEAVTNSDAPLEAELDEDEEKRRAREAALASTFDPDLAHAGKTDEELIEERQDEARLFVDIAIAAGVAAVLHEAMDGDAAEADLDGVATDADGSD